MHKTQQTNKAGNTAVKNVLKISLFFSGFHGRLEILKESSSGSPLDYL